MDAERAKENAAKSSAGIREGQAFLAANAKRAGVVSLPSGLQYEVIKAGTGTQKPTLNSNVKCHYTGTLLNGTKFDSSVDRGEPITFKLSNVILGWQEALQLMTVGSKWKLYIPANLAYGDNPPPGGVITAGSTLVFDVELLGIEN
jgi:FKBP-type peptidyl-prolyl cis-trans isomerase FklB